MSYSLLQDAITEAVQIALESDKSAINTLIPGEIVSYDAGTNRATIQISVPKRLADGEELPAPKRVQVPIVFPASGISGKQAALTFPLKPGDGVELLFQQRCIENWLSGRNIAPNDPRQYDLSDAVAIPGLNSGGVVGDATNVVLRFDKAALVIQPDGAVILKNQNGSITLTPEGNLLFKGGSILIDSAIGSFTLENHRHTNVQGGTGISGEPYK